MPRVVRVGVKSGVLPEPRQVVPKLSTSFELAAQAKVSSGFKDPKMAPKGSPANPPPRLPKTAQQKIEASAKEPRADKTVKMSEQAVWKRHIADVRRSYLKSSLLKYEAQEKRHKELREQRRKAGLESEALKLTEVTETLAESLTTPTIESSLLNDFIEPRTEEDRAELQAMREYNRKLTEHQVASRQQEKLLQLYEDASTYIVTEAQLEAALNEQFKPEISVPRTGSGKSQAPQWWRYMGSDLVRAASAQGQREDQLKHALQGTVQIDNDSHWNGAPPKHPAPGLKKVRAALEEQD